MRYKRAFQCHKCPQRNDQDGCPRWWEVVYENKTTGKSRVEKGCGEQLELKILLDVVGAAHGAQKQASTCQNEVANHGQAIIRGFQNLAHVVQEIGSQNGPRPDIQELSDR